MVSTTPPGSLAELRRIAPELAPSIAKLTVPAYILDRNGIVRWLNRAAVEHFGDVRGKRAAQVVAPEYADLTRREFAAKILGSQETTDATIDVHTASGRRVRVDISSTQLVDQSGAIVGVFGLADPEHHAVEARESTAVHLTPRQLDVLRHLAAGPLDGADRDLARDLGRHRSQPRARAPRGPGRALPARGRHPRA